LELLFFVWYQQSTCNNARQSIPFFADSTAPYNKTVHRALPPPP
jgi:hypothetical protein